jgi:hypothetical protein
MPLPRIVSGAEIVVTGITFTGTTGACVAGGFEQAARVVTTPKRAK